MAYVFELWTAKCPLILDGLRRTVSNTLALRFSAEAWASTWEYGRMSSTPDCFTARCRRECVGRPSGLPSSVRLCSRRRIRAFAQEGRKRPCCSACGNAPSPQSFNGRECVSTSKLPRLQRQIRLATRNPRGRARVHPPEPARRAHCPRPHTCRPVQMAFPEMEVFALWHLAPRGGKARGSWDRAGATFTSWVDDRCRLCRCVMSDHDEDHVFLGCMRCSGRMA
jgi:hypothetical protein